jgi:hypothetical protein
MPVDIATGQQTEQAECTGSRLRQPPQRPGEHRLHIGPLVTCVRKGFQTDAAQLLDQLSERDTRTEGGLLGRDP